MTSSNAMRLLEERHVAIVVQSLVWSNKMDLLALSNVRGEVSLHRLTWQRVWSLPAPKEAVTVQAMAWRPDGKVLAVAYSSQEVSLVDVENAEILHNTKYDQNITCLVWVEETLSNIDENSSDQFQNLANNFLPKLPSLSRNFGPMNKGSEENAEDSKKVGDQTRVNVLLVGTESGCVMLSVFGLFPCGCINMSDHVGGQKCQVLDVDISPSLDVLMTVVAVESPDTDGGYNLGVILLGTPVLAAHTVELQLLAKQHGHIISLLSYMAQTMASITEAWENILMEMDSKLSSYASTVSEGSVSADFLELLMLGTPSDELEMFLLQELTEKGLKKLGHSIELSYSNIQKLVLKHLQAVGQNILYHLAELKGMAHCTERFSDLGLDETQVTKAITSAAAFMTKATEVQQVIDSSMKNYKAFFRWLYVAILRLSDERLPPEITKIRQQDLTFIAEFLENFDGMGSKIDEVDGKATPQKTKFNLERLGQYLADEDLTSVVDTSQSEWHQFLEEDPGIAMHPSIIPRFKKMSLVQQHNHLKKSIDSVFKDPEKIIKTRFEPTTAIPFFHTKDPSKLKISCLTNLQDKKFLVAFLETDNDSESFHFLEIPLNLTENVDTKCSKFIFKNSNNDDSGHKVLDIQFFSEETLSVLLEQKQENRTAVFVQFPTKIAYEQGQVMKSGSLCANVPSCDAVSLMEPNTLRSMENLVASSFAVSGIRKVAVVLSESKRRVRLFEMEVEEEEEEEDAMDATNTTKDSETSQRVDVSTSTDHNDSL